MTGPRNWQAETARALSELFQPGRATKRDLVMAFRFAAVCGTLSIVFMLAALLTARGDQITIGYWDASVGGGVTPIASSSGAEIIYLYQDGSPSNIGPVFGGNLTAVTFTSNGSTWREAAFDNVFAGTSDTIRIYFSFQGVTGGGPLIFPTIFQSSEAQPGFLVVDQIFTCPAGVVFCDNYFIGGGTGVGAQLWDQTTGTVWPTFLGAAPGSPFTINEVFHIVANGPGGDIAGAILTQPDVAVPGPLAGAGLPGLIAAALALLGLARRRRAENAQ